MQIIQPASFLASLPPNQLTFKPYAIYLPPKVNLKQIKLM
jgi:hypothetical protein